MYKCTHSTLFLLPVRNVCLAMGKNSIEFGTKLGGKLKLHAGTIQKREGGRTKTESRKTISSTKIDEEKKMFFFLLSR